MVSLSVTLGSSIEKDDMSCREDVMWDDELYQNQGWVGDLVFICEQREDPRRGFQINNELVCPLLDKDINETALKVDQTPDKGL